MTHEQKSRSRSDRQLEQAPWVVQDYRQMNISAGRGVAVREFPLTTGQADDMLDVDARAIGVVQAKPKGHTLSGVETQSGKSLDGLPPALPNDRLPLPFAYESTGEVTQFTTTLASHARSRLVFSVHRPDELLRPVKLDTQVRGRLRQMPPLNSIPVGCAIRRWIFTHDAGSTAASGNSASANCGLWANTRWPVRIVSIARA